MRNFGSNRGNQRTGNFGKPKFGGSKSFNRGDRRGEREMFDAVCEECGKSCTIPFKPTGTRPVYCSNCFEKQGNGSGGERNNFKRNDFSRGNFGKREMFDSVCDKCGATCQLPFRPTPGKPVFCDNCFGKNSSREQKGGTDLLAEFKKLSEKMDRILAIISPEEKKILSELPEDVISPKLELVVDKKTKKDSSKIKKTEKSKSVVKKTVTKKKK